ncbi:MAG: tetratricopeptide repeat protein [Burkholderiaceae bacterium]|nr:tetratricopeptide repeat protein [Burkholderiaceae bacterium]
MRGTEAPPPAATATGPAPSVLQRDASYVGSATCSTCHTDEFKAWKGSHHDLAMQEATDATVLGDFNDTKFRHFGVETTFFRRDGKFMVRTDGPDGKLADFEISRTFGVWPLQQYMVAFPGGRYQMLPVAWDTRSKEQGGQRWFHVLPQEKLDYQNALHWTGRYQNWNLQCAACHSTNLRKGYDAGTDSYKTTFSEINVACESCHGPGSKHVEWAAKAKGAAAPGTDKGLTPLRSDWQEAWIFPPGDATYAQRAKPADPAAMNTCAACHARRSTLAEHGPVGAPLQETHRLAMLTAPNYHADGQQREEVFVWGSYLQSKMSQRGVTCMDCHDAHSLKLRAEGNNLCARCHNAAKFDTEKHSGHKPGSKGAECVACHMPEQNYMVVDARRDHAIRVPRPDLSDKLGSPNACTQCHTDKKPQWAAAAMDQWYGPAWRSRAQTGTTLHAGATLGAAALPSVLALADNPAQPAVIRATALTLAQPHLQPDSFPVIQKLLQNVDPALRVAALESMDPFDPAARVQAAAPLLTDPVLGVRIEAARLLADVPEAQLPVPAREARTRALKEYVDSLLIDADWPSSNVTLGNLYMRQGRADDAVRSYQRAISMDPGLVGAWLNLADAYRQSGRDAEGGNVLREGLKKLPKSAELHYALGLLLVREGQSPAALAELRLAAQLAPDNARYAYVHAIALNSSGQRALALTELKKALERHPGDRDILSALISINRESGDNAAALVYARKAALVFPDDRSIRQLIAQLEGAR